MGQAPEASHRRRGAWRSRLTEFAPSLAVGAPLLWLTLVPLAVLAVSAFKPTGFLLDPGFTFANLTNVYGDPRFWRLCGATLVFAGGAAALALALGAALAFLAERSDLPGRGLIRAAIILPMAMPPFLIAIGWILLVSPRTGALNLLLMQSLGLTTPPFDIYSLTGMIFVEGLSLTPSAFLVLAPALRNFDASMEEAALMSGAGAWRILWRVILPPLTPALAGAGAYLLIVSFMVFDVPGVIGMPAGVEVLSTHVYDIINNNPTGLPDYGETGAISLVVVAALGALCIVYRKLMTNSERFATVAGKAWRPRPFHLGRLTPLAAAFAIAYFLLAAVLPLGTLVWSSLLPYLMPLGAEALDHLTFANHAAFFADPMAAGAIAHSLVIALIAAIAVSCLTFFISYVVVRTKAPGRGALDLLAFLPLAMPGVLIGAALIYVYLGLRVAPVYGTIFIIAIAHTTVYLSFASRAMNAAMAQMHAELEEAARMSGASWRLMARRVLAPLAAPALGAVFLWVFAHSLRELSAALMLQGVDNKTIPTLLFGYWSQGQPTRAAAVGVWLAAGLTVVVALMGLTRKIAVRRGVD